VLVDERFVDERPQVFGRLQLRGFEQLGEEWFVDVIRQEPDRLTARRGDEGGDIESFVAMMAERDRPLADRRPDTAMDRLQPEAMKSATFRLDHTPPSGGGSRSPILSFSRRARLRTEGCAPLWRRRSPSAALPNALYRANSSSIQRGTKLVIADTAETIRHSNKQFDITFFFAATDSYKPSNCGPKPPPTKSEFVEEDQTK
jgi:hypothetical protein